jgi:hypothetical protein
MPQIGHVPGPSRRISGCIGHVHIAPSGVAAAPRFVSAVCARGAADSWAAGVARAEVDDAEAAYFSGRAANFERQPSQQK